MKSLVTSLNESFGNTISLLIGDCFEFLPVDIEQKLTSRQFEQIVKSTLRASSREVASRVKLESFRKLADCALYVEIAENEEDYDMLAETAADIFAEINEEFDGDTSQFEGRNYQDTVDEIKALICH